MKLAYIAVTTSSVSFRSSSELPVLANLVKSCRGLVVRFCSVFNSIHSFSSETSLMCCCGKEFLERLFDILIDPS